MNIKQEKNIHHMVSLIGGFIGGYGIITRASNFGSAETTNMIAIIVGLFDKNIEAAILRTCALIIYIAAIVFTIVIPKVSKIDVKYLSLIISAIGMVGMAFIETSVNPIIALFPIFFMSAFQWNSYPSAAGYSCSTIFSTNNLRQTIIGFTEYVAHKRSEDLAKGRFYGATLLYYYAGVAYACVATKLWGIKASFAGLVPVVIVWLMNNNVKDNKVKDNKMIK